MEKKATMKKIAEELGISINAVSLALNNKHGVSEDTRLKVLAAAEAAGYINQKARFAQTYQRHNFCLMLQDIYSWDLEFYGAVLFAIEQESKKRGFGSLLNFFQDDGMKVPDCIRRRQVAGIITIGKISNENVETLKSYGIPLVLVDHAYLSGSVDSIITNNRVGGFLSAKRLLELGFKEIGFFGDLNYSNSIRDRFAGYKDALASKLTGGSLEEYINEFSITGENEKFVQNNDFLSIKDTLLKSRIAQAYCCSNDFAAYVLIRALRSIDVSVPEEVSIIGFDNIALCEKMSPKLTTINVNKNLMGKKAVNRLIYLLEHKNEFTENTMLEVELVERESVKTPEI
ncbi:MAG: LacI family DNA-binding transcriptional regulator [Clostridiales bacterium]|jgi:LacI family transcriptional regulator|nr:LacI family DNA-binding transcriptional regulator [Clostridiales bacterium]MDR2752489.1 LacI family DNA-binding transcriptional regulator [Clostridiales bacterium]